MAPNAKLLSTIVRHVATVLEVYSSRKYLVESINGHIFVVDSPGWHEFGMYRLGEQVTVEVLVQGGKFIGGTILPLLGSNYGYQIEKHDAYRYEFEGDLNKRMEEKNMMDLEMLRSDLLSCGRANDVAKFDDMKIDNCRTCKTFLDKVNKKTIPTKKPVIEFSITKNLLFNPIKNNLAPFFSKKAASSKEKINLSSVASKKSGNSGPTTLKDVENSKPSTSKCMQNPGPSKSIESPALPTSKNKENLNPPIPKNEETSRPTTSKSVENPRPSRNTTSHRITAEECKKNPCPLTVYLQNPDPYNAWDNPGLATSKVWDLPEYYSEKDWAIPGPSSSKVLEKSGPSTSKDLDKPGPCSSKDWNQPGPSSSKEWNQPGPSSSSGGIVLPDSIYSDIMINYDEYDVISHADVLTANLDGLNIEVAAEAQEDLNGNDCGFSSNNNYDYNSEQLSQQLALDAIYDDNNGNDYPLDFGYDSPTPPLADYYYDQNLNTTERKMTKLFNLATFAVTKSPSMETLNSSYENNFGNANSSSSFEEDAVSTIHAEYNCEDQDFEDIPDLEE